MSAAAARYKRDDLFLKTADLIGEDRRGTRRDDGFHRGLRRQYEEAMKALVKSLQSINRTLDVLRG